MKKVLTVLGSVLLIMAISANVFANYDFLNKHFPEADSETEFHEVELRGFETSISIKGEEAMELIECVEKDREMIPEENLSACGWGFEVRVTYNKYDENDDSNILESYLCSFFIDSQHINTINWVKENGYWEDIKIDSEAPAYIIKKPDYLPYMDFWDSAIGLDLESYGVVEKLEGEEVESLCEYAYSTPYDNDARLAQKYLVYQETDTEGRYRYVTTLTDAQLTELVK